MAIVFPFVVSINIYIISYLNIYICNYICFIYIYLILITIVIKFKYVCIHVLIRSIIKYVFQKCGGFSKISSEIIWLFYIF